jgi:hypothetical protein
MTQDNFEIVTDLLLKILKQTERIAIALESQETKPPQWHKPIAEFKNFDWTAIGAKVLKSDRDGAAVVEWKSREYIRRSPENKFGAAIYFSRSIGLDPTTGKAVYERLITFKPPASVEPISRKAEAEI